MIVCMECGHVGENAASEEVDAIGGAQCEQCGHTDVIEEFGSYDDEQDDPF